jgi:hypothetical protein
LKLFEYLKRIQRNCHDCKVAYSKEGKRVSDEVKANSQIKSYPASNGCQLLSWLRKKYQKRTFMQANPGIKEEIYALMKYPISLQ